MSIFFEVEMEVGRTDYFVPKVLVAQLCLFATPWTVAHTRLLCPWDSPGKNTGVGCHSLLLGIFPTQGLNPGPPTTGRFFTM